MADVWRAHNPSNGDHGPVRADKWEAYEDAEHENRYAVSPGWRVQAGVVEWLPGTIEEGDGNG